MNRHEQHITMFFLRLMTNVSIGNFQGQLTVLEYCRLEGRIHIDRN